MAKSLKDTYESLAPAREPFLRRAREYAALTIPSILPPLGFTSSMSLPEPYQGFGAKAVVTLSARLLMALMPAGQTFMRLRVPATALLKSNTMSAPPEVEKGLALTETLCMAETELRQWRQPTSMALQLAIVTGNALEQMLPDNRLRVFRLDQYVIQRDPAGTILKVILCEKVAPSALPERAQSLVKADAMSDPSARVELYTGYIRNPDGTYRTRQEIEGRFVPGTAGKYANESLLPVWAIRWAQCPGEDYGRSKVEEHVADLRTLERFTQSLIEGAAMAARHVTLVKPNAAGGNLRQRIAKANNGDVLAGNPDDVKMLQFENIAGLQIVDANAQRVLQSLAAAFLMVSDLRRDAERVTATELRMLAEELEGGLGGTYSLLAGELQLPRARRLIYQMQKQDKLPKWPKDMVEPQITTGLEALGRQQEVRKVMQAGEILKGIPGAEEYVKRGELVQIALTGIGLPQITKSEQEVAKERADQARAMAVAQGVGDTVSAAGQAAVNAAAPQPA